MGTRWISSVTLENIPAFEEIKEAMERTESDFEEPKLIDVQPRTVWNDGLRA